MDRHLDYKVVFSDQTDYGNLYKWCLREVDQSGKSSADFIPWNWSLGFTASELSFHQNFEFDTYQKTDNRWGSCREHISGLLLAKLPYMNDKQTVRYSIMGTGRSVESIRLEIHPLNDESETERCEARGFVSSTMEHDFQDITSPDELYIVLHVRPCLFDKYARDIKANQFDVATIQLSGVSGAYSEWSPSISTRDVKLLESITNQNLEVSEAVKGLIPVLGNVGGVVFRLSCTRATAKRINSPDKDDNEIEKLLERPELTLIQVAQDNPETVSAGLFQLISENRKRQKRIVTMLVLIILVLILIWAK